MRALRLKALEAGGSWVGESLREEANACFFFFEGYFEVKKGLTSKGFAPGKI